MVLLTSLVVWTCPWWRYQMEAFSALLALCAGNSTATGEFPAQRSVPRSFDIFFDLRLNKRLSKNGEAGDLRRHHAHYDVNLEWQIVFFFFLWSTYPAGIWLCMVTTMTVKWTWNTCMSMIKWNVDWMHSYCDALCENTQVLCSGLIYLPLKNCPFYDP